MTDLSAVYRAMSDAIRSLSSQEAIEVLETAVEHFQAQIDGLKAEIAEEDAP